MNLIRIKHIISLINNKIITHRIIEMIIKIMMRSPQPYHKMQTNFRMDRQLKQKKIKKIKEKTIFKMKKINCINFLIHSLFYKIDYNAGWTLKRYLSRQTIISVHLIRNR